MLKFKDFVNENNNNDFIEITTPIGSQDFEIFREVVNKGIDSHLEAFVKSVFKQEGKR